MSLFANEIFCSQGMGVILGPGFDLRSRATRDASALTEGRDGSMHASRRGVIDDDQDARGKARDLGGSCWARRTWTGLPPFSRGQKWSPSDSYGSAARYGVRLAGKE